MARVRFQDHPVSMFPESVTISDCLVQSTEQQNDSIAEWRAIPYRDRKSLKNPRKKKDGERDDYEGRLKEYLTSDPTLLDPSKNPLVQLLKDGHLSAAVSLVRIMNNKPKYETFLNATRAELQTIIADRGIVDSYSGNTALHELARVGYCSFLKSILDPETVNVRNARGQTALHIAAEHGQIDDVRMLLKKGANLLADEDGYTPLHSVCASMEPNCEVAALLVKRFNSQTTAGTGVDLNAQTTKRKNTALHLAAGNVNATADFIKELADMDPTIPNKKHDTPFHVAAASTSPNNIMVAMLRTFPPNNRYCSVGDGDLDRQKDKSPLLNICARNGNARAVALLIQNGADLRTDVLHVVVQESVKNPAKIDGLIAVYDAIVANVVPWWSARKRTCCPLPETKAYKTELRQAMMYLTSWTAKDGRNVIELAIDIGAGEMLIEILNTTPVFREDEPTDNALILMSKYITTNMIYLSSQVPCIVLGPDRKSTLKTNIYKPEMPYLSRIVGSDKCWRDRSLLKTEPFLKLTQPMLLFAQRLWFCLGIIQLIYMLFFSALCLPTRCSLAVHFRFNFTDCNLTGSEVGTHTSFGLFLIWPVLVIAVMCIWCISNFFVRCRQNVRNMNAPQSPYENGGETLSQGAQGAHAVHRGGGEHCHLRLGRRRCKSSGEECRTGKDEAQPSLSLSCSQLMDKYCKQTLVNLLSWILDEFATIAFCVSVFVWFYLYTSHGPGVFPAYIESTSMVFLFGWIMTFSLFSGMSKQMHMFSLVLNEIIIKDILSNFLPIYMFVIIGFGFAVHTLRQTTLPMDDANSLNTTVFQVFLAGLTFNVDSLINGTDTTYYANGGRYGFYRVVYAAFVCLTVIVLLNVLIAMLGDRYSKAKLKAENVWRYSSVKLALPLHNIFHRFSLCDGRFRSLCCCCFGAGFRQAAAHRGCSGGVTNIERAAGEFVELEDKANWLTVTMTVGVNPRDNVQIARQESREQNKAFRFDSIPSYLVNTPKRVSAMPPEP